MTQLQTINKKKYLVTDSETVRACFVKEDVSDLQIQHNALCNKTVYIPFDVCKKKAEWITGKQVVFVNRETGQYLSPVCWAENLHEDTRYETYSVDLITMTEGKAWLIKEVVS